jgi:hypothetical protein
MLVSHPRPVTGLHPQQQLTMRWLDIVHLIWPSSTPAWAAETVMKKPSGAFASDATWLIFTTAAS